MWWPIITPYHSISQGTIKYSFSQPCIAAFRLHHFYQVLEVLSLSHCVLHVPIDAFPSALCSLIQGKAPRPTVDGVEIVFVPKIRAYAREFSGFATQGKALEEAVRLRAALLDDEVAPSSAVIISAWSSLSTVQLTSF